jgi:hypothetical protein
MRLPEREREREFMFEYDATFEDERVEDSIDDHLVPKLSNRDNVLLLMIVQFHNYTLQYSKSKFRSIILPPSFNIQIT